MSKKLKSQSEQMAKDLIERVMKMSDTEVEVKKLTEIKYLQTACDGSIGVTSY